MDKIKFEKKIRIFFYLYIAILVLSVIIIFKLISENTQSIDFGKKDFSENGFKLFIEVYQFPLYLIAINISDIIKILSI